MPNTTGGDSAKMIAVLDDHLRASPKIDSTSDLSVLQPIFEQWLDAEATGLGGRNNVMDSNTFGGSVLKHIGFNRMRAAWDDRCSCGHMRTKQVKKKQ